MIIFRVYDLSWLLNVYEKKNGQQNDNLSILSKYSRRAEAKPVYLHLSK